jgi:hypothetical protein
MQDVSFEPKRAEVAVRWRRLHNEELHNLYGSPNVIKVIKIRRKREAGHLARTRKIRNTYTVLIVKPERKRSRERPRRR